jgi:hypothetical protein
MTPYLGEIGKLVDFPDTYQRKYLHETVRNQTARRSGIVLHFLNRNILCSSTFCEKKSFVRNFFRICS